MTDTETTARERLLNFALSATPNEVTWEKAEQLADEYRAAEIDDAISRLDAVWRLAPESDRAPGINFAIGALVAIRDNPAARSTTAQEN